MCGVPVARRRGLSGKTDPQGLTGSRSASRPKTRPKPRSAAQIGGAARSGAAGDAGHPHRGRAAGSARLPTSWRRWAGAAAADFALGGADMSTGAFPVARYRQARSPPNWRGCRPRIAARPMLLAARSVCSAKCHSKPCFAAWAWRCRRCRHRALIPMPAREALTAHIQHRVAGRAGLLFPRRTVGGGCADRLYGPDPEGPQAWQLQRLRRGCALAFHWHRRGDTRAIWNWTQTLSGPRNGITAGQPLIAASPRAGARLLAGRLAAPLTDVASIVDAPGCGGRFRQRFRNCGARRVRHLRARARHGARPGALCGRRGAVRATSAQSARWREGGAAAARRCSRTLRGEAPAAHGALTQTIAGAVAAFRPPGPFCWWKSRLFWRAMAASSLPGPMRPWMNCGRCAMNPPRHCGAGRATADNRRQPLRIKHNGVLGYFIEVAPAARRQG